MSKRKPEFSEELHKVHSLVRKVPGTHTQSVNFQLPTVKMLTSTEQNYDVRRRVQM